MTMRHFKPRTGQNGRGLRTVTLLFMGFLAASTELAVAAPITQRVSVDLSGIEIPGGGRAASISADGRFVAFVSRVVDPNTGTIKAQVFVRDRGACSPPTPCTRLISVAPDGRHGNDDSSSPTISSDGNAVAFVSKAKNLLTGATGAADHVFVRDHAAGTTELISNGADGNQGNSFSDSPYISKA